MGLGFRILGLGFRVLGFGCWVLGFGWVPLKGLGFRAVSLGDFGRSSWEPRGFGWFPVPIPTIRV